MFLHTFYGSLILVAILGSTLPALQEPPESPFVPPESPGIVSQSFPQSFNKQRQEIKESFLAAAVAVRVTYGDMYPHCRYFVPRKTLRFRKFEDG